jgi:hypothetical protein
MSCCEGDLTSDQDNKFDIFYSDVLYKKHWSDGFLTLKYKGKTDNFSIRTSSQLCLERNPDGFGSDVVSKNICHNVKLVTRFPKERSVATHFLPDGTIKVGVHLGPITIGGQKPDLKAILKTDKSFGSTVAKVALEHQTESHENLTSFRWGCNDNSLTIGNRFIGKHKQFRYGAYLKANLTKFALLKYDAFVSFREGSTEVSLEHVSKDSNSISLGNNVLSYVLHRPLFDVAASLVFNLVDSTYKPIIGAAKEVNPNLFLKWRLEDWRTFVFSANINVNKNVKLGFGTSYDLTPAAFKAMVGDNSFRLPMGFGLEFQS